MSKRAALLLVLVFAAALCLVSPGPSVKAVSEAPLLSWGKTYGNIQGYSVAQSADGGYVIAAAYAIYAKMAYTDGKAVLIKTNSSGSIEWNKTIGEYPNSQTLINTRDGGFAVVQSNYDPKDPNSAESKIISCLIKTDVDGNLQWSQVFGESSSVYLNSIVEKSEGSYVLAGYTQSSSVYGDNALVIKTDSDGNLQWSRKYENGSRIVSIVEAADGGYVVGGGFDGKLWLGKLNQVGIIQWEKKYNAYGGANFLIETRDGGYALGGTSGSVVKTDSEGNIQWNRTYVNGKQGARFDCAVEAEEGGYVLAGASVFTTSRGWLVKTDSRGNVEWNATYSGLGESSVSSLKQTSDGGYVFTGKTSIAHDYATNIWLAKTTPSPQPNSQDNTPTKPTGSFPTLMVIAVSVAVVAVVAVAVLVYFKKHNRQDQNGFSSTQRSRFDCRFCPQVLQVSF